MSFVAIIKKKGSLDNTYVSVQNSLIFNMVKIIFTFLEVFTHGYRVHKWGREHVYRFTNRDCNFIDERIVYRSDRG